MINFQVFLQPVPPMLTSFLSNAQPPWPVGKAGSCVWTWRSRSLCDSVPTCHTPFSCLKSVYLLSPTCTIVALPREAKEYPSLEGEGGQPNSCHCLMVKLRVDNKCSKKYRSVNLSSYSLPLHSALPFLLNCLWTYLAQREFHLGNFCATPNICHIFC